jgi:hypothetical protein
MLIGQVFIVPAKKSNGVCDIVPSGNWSELVHSKLRHHLPNVAVLMDVDHVMLTIVVDVHAEIEADTPDIMHPEPLVHPIINLLNQALVTNDKEIIDEQNDTANEYGLNLIKAHEQSTVDIQCNTSNRDQEVVTSAVPNMRGLLQAMK